MNDCLTSLKYSPQVNADQQAHQTMDKYKTALKSAEKHYRH